MACLEETRTIDGCSFYVRQLPPVAALRLQMRLLKVIGPGLPFLSSKDKEDEKVFQALRAVLEGMTDADAVALVTDLVKMAAKDGKLVQNIDVEFAECPATTLFKVAAFVLEVNFKSFFGVLERFPGLSIPAK